MRNAYHGLTVQILHILLSGQMEWYPYRFLLLSAGKFIPPELASRTTTGVRTIEEGRTEKVHSSLMHLRESGKIDHQGMHGQPGEYRLRESEKGWAETIIKGFEARQSAKANIKSPSLAAVMARRGGVDECNIEGQLTGEKINLAKDVYYTLEEMKKAYEKKVKAECSWTTFVASWIGWSQSQGWANAFPS